MGFFDPEPKRRKKDFYDMERELDEFLKGLDKSKLLLVTGLRRYGKTSLILTGLNIKGLDYVLLDCRLLPSGMLSMNDLLFLLEEELSKKNWARRLLRSVEGISIGDFGIRFRERKHRVLVDVIDRLEGRTIVIDEAQELRRSTYRFDSLLAYIYDHVNTKVVVSGSQVGLLYRFLKTEDPEAPLFGRPYIEVKLGKLPDERAREFLIRGFEQEGFRIKDEMIDEAVNSFDGVIGWLAYFGYSVVRRGESLSSIKEKASKLALSELEHALKVYEVAKERYKEILRVVATYDGMRWSRVKRGVEARLGRIPNNTFSAMLKNLTDLGFLEKKDDKYKISDPILRIGIERFL